MAEIKIEKKKPIWPWILVGLIVLGIAIYFIADSGSGEREQSAYDTERNDGVIRDKDNRDNNVTGEERDNTRVLGNDQSRNTSGNPAVAAYVNFVRDDIKGDDLKEHPEKVRQAFMHLTEACEAKAQQVGYKSAQLNIAREQADQMVSGTSDINNSGNIRATADILAAELANIQQSKFPDLDKEASKLREASAEISPDEPITDQNQEVKSFLTEAADLLENMEEELSDNR
jgi:hypothetical protein